MTDNKWDEAAPTNRKRWGMVVDINRCVGCQTCTAACKHTNDTTPGVQWRKVLDVETGLFPDVERVFLVVGCQHCAEPPCVPVCPTGATKQRSDGLITMDYELCIGCASCAVACPYQARTIVTDKKYYYDEETAQEKSVAHEERFGVAQKCTFCIDRIDQGLEEGLTPGKDWQATPACASSCIASAIKFGDFNDPDSEVSILTAEHKNFQMHSELGTDPQIRYLYETPSIPGRDIDRTEHINELPIDRENSLAGQPQTFWDMRAAMNFIMGGLGSGLIIMTCILHIFISLEEQTVLNIFSCSAAIIAVGLFFVWLKIGRKLRAIYVILRPQTSWMSREVYVVGVLYLLGFINYFAPSSILLLLISVTAFIFLYCQARILYSAKGIPTWRARQVPLMFVTGGLCEGAGLLAIIGTVYPQTIPTSAPLALFALVFLTANLLIWQNYTRTLTESGVGLPAKTLLLKVAPKVYAISYLLPMALFIILFAWPDGPRWLLGTGGLMIIYGNFYWKSFLITKACHQQSYALEKFPQRGSGRYAAPSRV